LALLFLLGLGATIVRLLEARRTGLSLRLQVFIPLAATTLLLSAMFAGFVIDRFTARASLFATRAAEDEARAIAELAAPTPGDADRRRGGRPHRAAHPGGGARRRRGTAGAAARAARARGARAHPRARVDAAGAGGAPRPGELRRRRVARAEESGGGYSRICGG